MSLPKVGEWLPLTISCRVDKINATLINEKESTVTYDCDLTHGGVKLRKQLTYDLPVKP